VSKIKSDSHGPYVKVNGGVYRPQLSNMDYHIHTRVTETVFAVGDEVKVKNVNQTPFCRVIRGLHEEVWGYHGAYHLRPVEECWNPNNS
jgi:hypothetical protein